jgi:energy-coupling factor transporter ATP-binding protein EcfA2
MDISEWLKEPRNFGIAAAIVGALAGAVLTKLLPFLFRVCSKLFSAIARRLGGRFAFKSFQRTYLDWIVTELRELKLTGIVSYDDAKKPQLEQVFVSLRVGDEKAPTNDLEAVVGAIRTHSWGPVATFVDKLPLADDDVRLRLMSALTNEIIRIEANIPIRSFTFSLVTKTLSRAPVLFGLSNWSLRPSVANATNWRTSLRHCIAARALRSELRKLGASNIAAPGIAQLLSENSRVAILGGPGSGKTTILQYIALSYARAKAGDPKLRQRRALKRRLGSNEWRLPIYFPLSTLSGILMDLHKTGEPPSLLDLLPRILPPDLQREYADTSAAFFRSRLEHGDCIILLDGLDEVPTDEEFKVIVRGIESMAITYPKNRFVVTSRIAGWRTGVGADFRTFYVNDLSDAQVHQFIDLWYDAVELNSVVGRLKDEGAAARTARLRRANQRAADLKKALTENSGVRLLAINPMLLSIIALVHRSLANLPRERAKLYAECSKILLEQWDISRGVRVDDTALKLDQKEAIMRRLAFGFHSGQIGDAEGGREVPRKAVEEVIAEMMPDLGRSKSDATHLLTRLVERSGLLVERKRGSLAFAHLTFQEYFTAHHLAIGETRSHLEFILNEKRLNSDWWHEVVLLYAGLISDSSELILRIMRAPRPSLFDDTIRLSALALGEAVAVKEKTVRETVLGQVLTVRNLGRLDVQVTSLPPEAVEYLLDWARSSRWLQMAARNTITRLIATDRNMALNDLLSGAFQSSSALVREAALVSVRYVPVGGLSESNLERIFGMSSDGDSDVRAAAIAALEVVVALAPARCAALLCEALSDSEERVAVGAMLVLIRQKDAFDNVALVMERLDRMLSLAPGKARVRALHAFSAFASAARADQLSRFLEVLIEKDKGITPFREELLDGAAEAIADTRCVGVLVERSKDRRGEMRALAVRALGGLASAHIDDSVVSACLRVAEDPKSKARDAGRTALIALSRKRAAALQERVLQSFGQGGMSHRIAIWLLQHQDWSNAPQGSSMEIAKLLAGSGAVRSAAFKALSSCPDSPGKMWLHQRTVRECAAHGVSRGVVIEFLAHHPSTLPRDELLSIADNAIRSIRSSVAQSGAKLLAVIGTPDECYARRQYLYRQLGSVRPKELEVVGQYVERWLFRLTISRAVYSELIEELERLCLERLQASDGEDKEDFPQAAQALAKAATSSAGSSMLFELFRELQARRPSGTQLSHFFRLIGKVGASNTSASVVGMALRQVPVKERLALTFSPFGFEEGANMVKDLAKTVEPNELAEVLEVQDSDTSSRVLVLSVIAAVPECGRTEAGGRIMISLLGCNVVRLRLAALGIAKRFGLTAPGVVKAIHVRLLDEDRRVRDRAWEVLFPPAENFTVQGLER